MFGNIVSIICNGNGTEWSTTKGVIRQVIYPRVVSHKVIFPIIILIVSITKSEKLWTVTI